MCGFSVGFSKCISTAGCQTGRQEVISNDSLEVKKAKGSERNVMLNASDATKPREIQIGLPSEDVNVL